MIQEPAGAPQPADRVPREPVTLGVAPAHVLALAGRHVVHHVQVVVLGDVAGPGCEHATLVRHCGRGRWGWCNFSAPKMPENARKSHFLASGGSPDGLGSL